MANPNIVNVSSVYGNTSFANAVSSSAAIVVNTQTNKVRKINSIYVANTGTADTGINVYITSSSTDYYLAYQVNVPDGTTLVVTDKNSPIYLEENDQLKTQCTTSGGTATVTVSYEIIDDA